MNRVQRWWHRRDAVVEFGELQLVGRCVRIPSDRDQYPETVRLVDAHAPLSARADIYDAVVCVAHLRRFTSDYVAYRLPAGLRKVQGDWSPDWRTEGGKLRLKAFALVSQDGYKIS